MKGMKAILSSAFSVTIILILLAEFEILTWAEAFTILPAAILVCITGWYAVQNYRMAEANEKMVKEMLNQRYDSVRPVIDIKINEGDRKTIDPSEFRVINYTLTNIGLGPSIDSYLFKQTVNKEITQLSDLGTIPAGTEPLWSIIRLETNDLPTKLIAYYRDVYDRSFESKREISHPEKDKPLSFGILKHRKLDKNEDKDIISKVWPTSKSEGSK